MTHLEPSLDHPAATWPDEAPTETTVELDWVEWHGSNPYTGPSRRWDYLEHDNTHCSRGHLCPSYEPKYGTTAIIGGYIGSDSEGIYPRHEWKPVFYFPSAPGMPICEDCADLVDDVDYDDSVFTGTIADAHWFIDRAPAYCADTGKFYAWVGYFSPDGGLDHEIELGVFDTVGVARTAIAVWGGERNRELDDAEWMLDPDDADFLADIGDPRDPERCSTCGLPDNCGDCNHFGTPHFEVDA